MTNFKKFSSFLSKYRIGQNYRKYRSNRITDCMSIKKKQSCRLFHIDLHLDKSFQSVNIDGMIYSLGEFESLIATKSSCLKIHNSKDDHDLFISNANTHEGLNKNLFFSINFSFSLFRIQRSFKLHSTTYQ